MIEAFPFYLALVLVIVLLVLLANKIKVAYPVLLVLAGLIISFIPGLPEMHVDPELIFIIFLPPLLYEASWSISWKEMWRWRRIISSFAFVVVFLTAMSVAFVANAFIPGFSLALGFLLGGIVSPPDAVSASSILRFVKLPKRLTSILEGESLLNDASSLIIFRFAMIAVATGQFVWYNAALSFLWMVVGGVGIGLLIGWLFMNLHKILPTDSNTDTVLTLLTPYIMYIAAEHFHASGVLAVVCGGLLLSNNRHRFLGSRSRLHGLNVWESLAFVLNGLVFLMIGLALPDITADLDGVSMTSAIGYGVLITAVLIIGRILSAYGAVVVTRIASKFITVADKRPPVDASIFVLGWTGMRGVVSLAAALSIPIAMDNQQPFPQRNLILFITFIVILLTLLIQGLTLPIIIKRSNIVDPDHHLPEAEADSLLRKELAEYGLQQLKAHHADALKKYPALQHLARNWEDHSTLAGDIHLAEETKAIYLDLLERQRKWLHQKNKEEMNMDEDIVRRYLSHLDMEEEKWKYL